MDYKWLAPWELRLLDRQNEKAKRIKRKGAKECKPLRLSGVFNLRAFNLRKSAGNLIAASPATKMRS